MFQALLIRRYLFSKIMPLLAAAAVLLCTTMVLVVWSVMGGFLTTLIASGRTMTGDVIVGWPNVGFPHYEKLVALLEEDNLVQAAAPVIETYGLIGLPNDRKEMLFVRGVEPASYARVTEYGNILWWKPIDKPLAEDRARQDPRLAEANQELMRRLDESGRTLTVRNIATGKPEPGIALGIEVTGFNAREAEGFYTPRVYKKRDKAGNSISVDEFMPNGGSVVLSVLPLDSDARIIGEQASARLPVANEFHSGVFELDSKVAIVPLSMLQGLLRMDAVTAAPQSATTPTGGEDGFATGIDTGKTEVPARVTHVLVRGKGDYGELGAATVLKERVQEIYARFAALHEGQVPSASDITIMTWEDQNRTLIQAVKKETGLVLFLFSLISMTAAFLMFAIFWAMVAEKTKDIGIMRALGASSASVAGVWLGYGIVIGIVGALLGLGLGAIIIRNINPIHQMLGTWLGIKVWDPAVYYFSEIPNDLTAGKAVVVCLGGILCCIIGALVPAVRAARMRPVKALRFE